MEHYTQCPFCRVRRYDPTRRFDRCYWCHLIRRDGLVVSLSDYLDETQEEGIARSGSSMLQAYGRMVSAGDIDGSDPSEVETALTIMGLHAVEYPETYGDYPAASVFRDDKTTFFALSDSVDGLVSR